MDTQLRNTTQAATASTSISMFKESTDKYNRLPHLLQVIESNWNKEASWKDELFDLIQYLLLSERDCWVGSVLVSLILKKHSEREPIRFASRWITSLMKMMNKGAAEASLELCCQNIGRILVSSSTSDELSRTISANVINPLLAIVTRKTFEQVAYRFDVIKICLQHYPSSCISHKSQIEAICWHQLNSNIKVSPSVYICLSLLPQCGARGKGGQKHTENWTASLLHYVNKINVCVELIFDDDSTPRSDLFGVNLQSSRTDRLFFIQKRLVHLTKLISVMLSNDMSYSIDVPLDPIIKCLCKLSNLSSPKDTAAHIHTEFMLLYYPFIASSMLEMVRCLILQLKCLLLPYKEVLFDVLTHALHISMRDASKIYLVNVLGATSAAIRIFRCTPPFIDELISVAGQLIRPKQSITSNSSMEYSKPGKYSHKKRKKYTHPPESSEQKVPLCDETYDPMVVVLALNTLISVMEVCGPSLSTKCLDSISRSVGFTVMEIYQGSFSSAAPYKDVSCRVKLFQLVESLVTCANHQKQTFSSFLMSISRFGLNDTSDCIIQKCQMLVARLDTFLHNNNQPSTSKGIQMSDSIDLTASPTISRHFLDRSKYSLKGESTSFFNNVATSVEIPERDQRLNTENILTPAPVVVDLEMEVETPNESIGKYSASINRISDNMSPNSVQPIVCPAPVLGTRRLSNDSSGSRPPSNSSTGHLLNSPSSRPPSNSSTGNPLNSPGSRPPSNSSTGHLLNSPNSAPSLGSPNNNVMCSPVDSNVIDKNFLTECEPMKASRFPTDLSNHDQEATSPDIVVLDNDEVEMGLEEGRTKMAASEKLFIAEPLSFLGETIAVKTDDEINNILSTFVDVEAD